MANGVLERELRVLDDGKGHDNAKYDAVHLFYTLLGGLFLLDFAHGREADYLGLLIKTRLEDCDNLGEGVSNLGGYAEEALRAMLPVVEKTVRERGANSEWGKEAK